MKMNIYLLVVTLLSAITSCVALPNGAPLGACSTLLPFHNGGISAQQDDPPYTVSVDKIGEKSVRVTISSPTHQAIQGFILQARSAVDHDKFIAGEFKSSEVAKGINCHGKPQSTLTHKSADPKTQITTEWTATDTNVDMIIFRATVAKTYDEFWEKIDSEPVTIGTDHEMSSTEENSDAHSTYDGCFKSKGCFGIPQMCIDISNCSVLLTYEKNPAGIKFTMHGSLKDSEYMAMGLSDDDRMGDDFVTECLRVGRDVKLRNSWNEGKSNTRTTEPSSEYRVMIENGVAKCVWIQPYVTSFGERTYKLDEEKYHVLLAKGEVDNGRLRYHNSRLASNEPVDFSALNEMTDSDKTHDDSTTEFQHESTAISRGKQTVMPTSSSTRGYSKSSSSQFSSSLFWVVFFGVFYTGGRNVLKGLI